MSAEVFRGRLQSEKDDKWRTADRSEGKEKCSQFKNVHKTGDVPLSISPQRSINSVRGVNSGVESLDLSANELLEGLPKRNVVKVGRINIRWQNKKIPQKHIILCFGTTVLPESQEAGYIKIGVRPYIPNWRRCNTC
ncbi:hypothetical protein HPB48_013592 [Haemaphysalis longicornis]|uniref:Uncharacterized protein n=1 Tax=Haemaphysalis longicornis TaxID=44386 RepID=A0A9J6GWX3_HAELO|nr:hypothetical protein HPB48_013592 [Haemaphysalis longicornis]